MQSVRNRIPIRIPISIPTRPKLDQEVKKGHKKVKLQTNWKSNPLTWFFSRFFLPAPPPAGPRAFNSAVTVQYSALNKSRKVKYFNCF